MSKAHLRARGEAGAKAGSSSKRTEKHGKTLLLTIAYMTCGCSQDDALVCLAVDIKGSPVCQVCDYALE